MPRKSIVKAALGFLTAACVVVSMVVVSAGALSQNTNSSTTAQDDTGNTNAGATRRGRRGRRGSRARVNANTDAATDTSGGTAEEGNTSDAGMQDAASGGQGMAGAGTQNTGGGVQENLDGTYAGRLTMTGGHDMSGDATLTITGQSFTLEAGGMTHSGRVYAINTRNYVGAAFYFADVTDPASNTPLAASVRVRRRGNSFTATPVPGARNRMTFTGRSSS